jgi:hypothetical protein
VPVADSAVYPETASRNLQVLLGPTTAPTCSLATPGVGLLLGRPGAWRIVSCPEAWFGRNELVGSLSVVIYGCWPSFGSCEIEEP